MFVIPHFSPSLSLPFQQIVLVKVPQINYLLICLEEQDIKQKGLNTRVIAVDLESTAFSFKPLSNQAVFVTFKIQDSRFKIQDSNLLKPNGSNR